MPITLFAACPPPLFDGAFQGSSLISSALEAYLELTRSIGIDCTFGIEIRAAYRLELAYANRPDFVSPPFRQFILRPSVEPILLSFSDALRPCALDPNAVDRFMSCIHGVSVKRRSAACRITPNKQGNFVQFPEPGYASEYSSRLSAQAPLIDDLIIRAGYVYAEVLLSHPYMDGNGRLARAMVISSLAEGLGGQHPILPLGPVFYAKADQVADALQVLAVTGNWRYFMTMFESLLEDSLKLAILILGQRL